MAYARIVKERARQLYASGQNFEQISRALLEPEDRGGFGKYITPQTIARWKKDGDPKGSGGEPRDWDVFRTEIEENAAKEVSDKLKAKRTDLALKHFDDLEFARLNWRRAFYEEDESGGLRPRVLTPAELNFATSAYSRIQAGQRTIFGEAAYVVAVAGSNKDGAVGGVDPEVVAALEDALTRTHADPGAVDSALVPPTQPK